MLGQTMVIIKTQISFYYFFNLENYLKITLMGTMIIISKCEGNLEEAKTSSNWWKLLEKYSKMDENYLFFMVALYYISFLPGTKRTNFCTFSYF